MYLTYFQHKITLVFQDNKKKVFRSPLKEFEQRINQQKFIKINQGTLINIEFCKDIEDGNCVMKDNSRFSISREKRKEVKNRILHYWEGIGISR